MLLCTRQVYAKESILTAPPNGCDASNFCYIYINGLN